MDQPQKPSAAAGRLDAISEAARVPSQPAPFPFAEAMMFGLGVLRLSPRDFWSMTPHELARATEGVYGRRPGAPARAALEDLMKQFPDEGKTHG